MDTTPLPPKPGALKFGWLVRLKISVRNCSLRFSVIGKSLKIEKSRRWKPGPGTLVTPPKAASPERGEQPGGEFGIGVKVASRAHGCTKAAGLPNQLRTPL